VSIQPVFIARHDATAPATAGPPRVAVRKSAGRAKVIPVVSHRHHFRGNRMRRSVLYSRSEPGAPATAGAADGANTAPATPETAPPPSRRARLKRRLSDPRALWVAVLLLAALHAFSTWRSGGQRVLTQQDIAAAVRHSLENDPLPSATARAAEAIAPSVVRVTGWRKDKAGQEIEHGVGTGVVIVDKGTILTNLHVVQAADTIKVRFADGLESTASVTGVRPEHDLAVLQAHKIPDDLHAATMRSTHDLRPGDTVVAVGYPFGIGPSVSAGVVSGLRRTFVAPDKGSEKGQEMTNLIQFDAAANPGNSGGPLVTLDGEVVGIVTAIYNPTPARTFLGIAFAVPIENAASAAGMPPF
jgi:S1-C subfamily serine protease